MLALALGKMTEIQGCLNLAAALLIILTMCGCVISWELIISFLWKENVPKDTVFEIQLLGQRPQQIESNYDHWLLIGYF